MVPDTDTGDDRPERSEEPSERSLVGASRSPVAFVLDEPIAGAAFWPSVLPTCNRLNGRNVKELAVDTTDSVGLFGRSIDGGRPATSRDVLEGTAMEDRELRGSRGT